MYLIVLLPNYKHTYDQIDQIEKYIRALYRKLVLFLRSKNSFCYIPENESEQDILGWNKSGSIRVQTTGFKLFPYTCNRWSTFSIPSWSVFVFKNQTEVHPGEMVYALLFPLHNSTFALFGSIVELESCDHLCVQSSCFEKYFRQDVCMIENRVH